MSKCKKCDDTGSLDYAGFALDPCTDCIRQHQEYAARAMQGMLAHQKRYEPRPNDPHDWHQALAKEAFEIADAMLAASRNKGTDT